jgi:hypothetical protein
VGINRICHDIINISLFLSYAPYPDKRQRINLA